MGQPTFLLRGRADQQGENLAVAAFGRVLGWDSFLFAAQSYSNRTIQARLTRPVDRQAAFFNRQGHYTKQHMSPTNPACSENKGTLALGGSYRVKYDGVAEPLEAAHQGSFDRLSIAHGDVVAPSFVVD